MEKQVVNKTPHDIHIMDAEGNVLRTYPRGNGEIRIALKTIRIGVLDDGTPLSQAVYGEPVGLPEYDRNILYIVSQIVKAACPERQDLLVPSEFVRDANGVIIGCKSLGT